MEATKKITLKPLVYSDKINKARDMSGLRKWSRESRLMGTVMLVLGWFTIPAEVFLRRRFGYRWFTPLNFYTGGFLLIVLTFLQYVMDEGQYWIARIGGSWNPFYTEKVVPDYTATTDMVAFTWIYSIMGIHHLFRRWWNSQTNMEIHSYDDGTSWLEFFGGILMWLINKLSVPLIGLYLFLWPARKNEITSWPKPINDRATFTDTILEPFVFFWLAYHAGYTVFAFWLYMTAFAVAVHAGWKQTARRSKILDFKDSMLEARAMAELKNGASTQEKKSTNTAKKGNIKPTPVRTPNYPDLITIIEELHMRGSHLS